MKRGILIFFVAVAIPVAAAVWALCRAPSRLAPAAAELTAEREIINHLEIRPGSALDGLNQLCVALGLRLDVDEYASRTLAARQIADPIILDHVTRRAALKVVPRFLVANSSSAIEVEGRILHIGDMRLPTTGPVVSRTFDIGPLLRGARKFTEEADALATRTYGRAPKRRVRSAPPPWGSGGGPYDPVTSGKEIVDCMQRFDAHPSIVGRPLSTIVVGERLIVTAAMEECARIERVLGELLHAQEARQANNWPCGAELDQAGDAPVKFAKDKRMTVLIDDRELRAGGNWVAEENLATLVREQFSGSYDTRIYDVRDIVLKSIGTSRWVSEHGWLGP
ncbi:MAG: hypothetical protein ABSH20_18470, partial [Tepidisphaeraceae bacterium]